MAARALFRAAASAGLASLMLAGCGPMAATPSPAMQSPATPGRAPMAEPSVVDIGSGDAATPVALVPGQLLRVHLRESPATGYRWSLQSEVPQSLRLEADPGIEPVAGEMRTWSFRALRPDMTRLRFAYRRAWEGADEGSETISFDLHIR
ncbi:MAG TPA: protease inhibitor I42 family protein [Stenotrophomonas sp.]